MSGTLLDQANRINALVEANTQLQAEIVESLESDIRCLQNTIAGLQAHIDHMERMAILTDDSLIHHAAEATKWYKKYQEVRAS